MNSRIQDNGTIGRLLDRFFGLADNGDMIEWRSLLEGEALVLEIAISTATCVEITALTYLADHITQVAAPKAFDALRCASAINRAITEVGGSQ